jgi:hypothetical protein
MDKLRCQLLHATIGLGGLGGLAPAALAAEAETASEAQAQSDQTIPSQSDSIIITGRLDPALVAALPAEAELDANAIAAFGFDTVGDLLDELIAQVDPGGTGPVILVNGQPSNGLADVSDLPTEAVERIQVLPGSAAAGVGQPPTKRVINVVIRPNHAQVTLNAEGSLATAGGGQRGTAEASLLKLSDGNRRSLTLRATLVDPLFERDRSILGDFAGTPYALDGNVVSAPVPGGEISPTLSSLAGRITTVAGAPSGRANPGLADFAARSGLPNSGDLSAFRTLLGRQAFYSGAVVLTQRLSPVTTVTLNLRGEWSDGQGLGGASAHLLLLPASSPFSPFARDVLVARYLGDPLRLDQDAATLSAAAVLNTRLGNWRVSLNANYSHRISHAETERGFNQLALQAAVLAGTASPFGPIGPALLGPQQVDQSRSQADNAGVELLVNGTPFSLPGGPVQAALRLGWRADRFTTSTVGPGTSFASNLHRDEEIAQLSLVAPLLGARQLGGIGDLSLDLTGVLRHVTGAGQLEDYAAGVTLLRGSALTLRAGLAAEEVAPSPNLLTDPVIAYENFRTFDFVRQETVLVRYVVGGNPALPVERRRTTSLTATLRPIVSSDLALTADYSRVVGRGQVSGLPPVTAEVQLAFPDRFQRDASGRLTVVDARPVGFERTQREQFRWGFSFSQTLGLRSATPSSGTTSGGAALALSSGWRINLGLNHTWTLSNTRLARAGLPEVDLLNGGAVGYGSGVSRHSVQGNLGVVHQGIGVQFTGNWRGGSRINAGTLAAPSVIRFASRFDLDARLFANLGPLFPHSALAKGMRISVAVENLFDAQQRVTDQTGMVPRRYQPYLLDPLGRTITIGIRKAF